MNIRNSINIRLKLLKRAFIYLKFSLGGKNIEDMIQSYFLGDAMENPFQPRSNSVENHLAAKGNIASIKHQYFKNISLK